MPNNPQSLSGVSANPALQWLIQNDSYLSDNLALAMSRGNINGFDTNDPNGTGAVYNPTNGHTVRLGPGMAVTAGVKAGRRRVIDYAWSPLAKAASEAGRER